MKNKSCLFFVFVLALFGVFGQAKAHATLLNFTGFETGDNQEANSIVGIPSSQASNIRTGSYSLRINTSNANHRYYFSGISSSGIAANLGRTTTTYYSFYLKMGSLPPSGFQTIAGIDNSTGNSVVSLTMDSTGNLYIQGTTGSNSAGVFTAGGSYKRVEISCVTGGSCSLSVNGGSQQIVTANNFTQDRIYFGSFLGTYDAYIDDVTISDSSISGDYGIVILKPTAVSIYDQWTLGAGISKPSSVSEIPVDGDTSYIKYQSLTNTLRQGVDLTNESAAGVAGSVLSRKDIFIARSEATYSFGLDYFGVRNGIGTNDTFTPMLTTSYKAISKIETNSFGIDDRNIEVGSLNGANSLRVSGMYVIVLFNSNSTPTITSSPTISYQNSKSRTGPSTTWNLSFTATDNEQSSVNQLNYTVKNSSGSTIVGPTNFTSGTLVSVNLAYNVSTNLVEGTNSGMYVTVSDGSLTTNSTSFTVNRDSTAPTSSPPTPSSLSGSTYSVSFTPSDTLSTNPGELSYSVNTTTGGGGTLLTNGTATTTQQKTTAAFADNGLVSGNNNRYVRVCDGANNCSDTLFIVNFNPQPTVDTAPESGVSSYFATLKGVVNPYGYSVKTHFRVFNSNPGNCNSDSGGIRFPALPTWDIYHVTNSLPQNFSYTIPATSAAFLTPNTSFWYCSYAISGATVYKSSTIESFTTKNGPATPCDPPTNSTLSIPDNAACTFYGPFNGVDEESANNLIALGDNVDFTINLGQKITFRNRSIGLNANQILAAGVLTYTEGLYVHDKDGDGYLDDRAQYVGSTPSAATEFVRRYAVRSTYDYHWKTVYSGAIFDCDPNNGNVYRVTPNSVVTDLDHDGYKTASAATTTVCVGDVATFNGRTYFKDTNGNYSWLITNQVVSATIDCDDNNPAVSIGQTWYQDLDGDTYGNNAVTQFACGKPAGYVANNTDCLDSGTCPGGGAASTCWQNLSAYTDSDNDGYGVQYAMATGNAGTTAEDSSVGSISWTTPTTNNVGTSNDVYNTKSTTSTGNFRYLKATNFGLTGVSGTVRGIVVEVERKGSTANSTKDYSVRLVKTAGFMSNGIVGNDYADDSSFWPTTDGYKVYGSANDLWGYAWTAADITSSNFGVVIAPKTVSAAIPSIDHIRIRVYYGNSTYSPVCSGATLPAGYTSNANDCFDAIGQSAYYQNRSAYNDLDGDGVKSSTTTINVCSGATLIGYSTTPGTDCSDSNSSAWQNRSCYIDADNDTYNPSNASSQTACTGSTCIGGWTDTKSSIADCYDLNANAYSGSSSTFSTVRGSVNDSGGNTGNSYDYNCDGSETKEPIYNCIVNTNCSFSQCFAGFSGFVPGCGTFGQFVTLTAPDATNSCNIRTSSICYDYLQQAACSGSVTQNYSSIYMPCN